MTSLGDMLKDHGALRGAADNLMRALRIGPRMGEKVTDALSAERDAYLRQRDEAIGERNEILRQRDVAIGERNEILRQRDAWIGAFNELERQIDVTIEDRNLPAERKLWRIRAIVYEIANETAVPDEKLITGLIEAMVTAVEGRLLPTERGTVELTERQRCSATAAPWAKVLHYIMAGAIAILVVLFVLLPIIPFLAAWGWYDRARQRGGPVS